MARTGSYRRRSKDRPDLSNLPSLLSKIYSVSNLRRRSRSQKHLYRYRRANKARRNLNFKKAQIKSLFIADEFCSIKFEPNLNPFRRF